MALLFLVMSLHSVGVSPLEQRSRIICFFIIRRFYSPSSPCLLYLGSLSMASLDGRQASC
jgi:hypothetical protein